MLPRRYLCWKYAQPAPRHHPDSAEKSLCIIMQSARRTTK
ncbi:hypothetical protein BN132_2067 [Cronobacter turicensis 564]|nr:hypothetical protein BN132_2067 [Cronobacter turicensis 564]